MAKKLFKARIMEETLLPPIISTKDLERFAVDSKPILKHPKKRDFTAEEDYLDLDVSGLQIDLSRCASTSKANLDCTALEIDTPSSESSSSEPATAPKKSSRPRKPKVMFNIIAGNPANKRKPKKKKAAPVPPSSPSSGGSEVAQVKKSTRKANYNTRSKSTVNKILDFKGDALSVPVPTSYNPNMARQFPAVERTEEEQKIRDKNTLAARNSRAKAKSKAAALEEEYKEAYGTHINHLRSLAAKMTYANELCNTLGGPTIDWIALWESFRDNFPMEEKEE